MRVIINLRKITMWKKSDYIKHHAGYDVENRLDGAKNRSKIKDLSGISMFQERAEMGWQEGRLNKRVPESSYKAVS